MVMVTKKFHNALTGERTERTYDTAEVIGSDDWIAKYMPEYAGLGADNKITTGGQTNSAGQRAPRITRTANTGAGAIFTPWAMFEQQHSANLEGMSEGEKIAYWNKMNYFRNGGTDQNGNATINPRDLDGMKPAGTSASGGVQGGWVTKNGSIFRGGQLPSQANPYGVNATLTGSNGVTQTESKYGFVWQKPDGTKYSPAWNSTARILEHESWKEGPRGNPFTPEPLPPYMSENVGANISGKYGYPQTHDQFSGYQPGQQPGKFDQIRASGSANTPYVPGANAPPPTGAPPHRTTPYNPNDGYGQVSTPQGSVEQTDVAPQGTASPTTGTAPGPQQSSSKPPPTDSSTPQDSPAPTQSSGTSQQNAAATAVHPNQVPRPVFGGASSVDYGPTQLVSSDANVTHKPRESGGSPASDYRRPLFAGPTATSTDWFNDLSNRGIGRGDVPGGAGGSAQPVPVHTPPGGGTPPPPAGQLTAEQWSQLANESKVNFNNIINALAEQGIISVKQVNMYKKMALGWGGSLQAALDALGKNAGFAEVTQWLATSSLTSKWWSQYRADPKGGATTGGNLPY